MSFHSEDQQKLARGTLLNIAGGVSLASFRAFSFVLRYMFGGMAFGLYVLSYNAAELILNFLLGGFNDAITYFTASELEDKSPEGQNRLYSSLATGIFFPAMMGLIISFALWLSGDLIYRSLWNSHSNDLLAIFKLTVWIIPLMVLVHQPVAAIKAKMEMKDYVLVTQVLQPMLAILFALFLYALFDMGIIAMVWGMLGSLVLMLPLSFYFYSKHFSISKTIKSLVLFRINKKLISFAIPQSANMALNLGLVKMDSLMLSVWVNANALGIYALVSEFTQMIRLAKMAFSNVFGPLVANYQAKNNKAGIEQSLLALVKWTSLISVPLMFIIMTFYPDLILGAGQGWSQPAIYPWLLLTGPMMSSFFGLAGNLLLMTGHSRLLLMNSAITGSINLILNYLFIPHWGVTGAALATAIANFSISFLQILEMKYFEGIRFRMSIYSKTLIGMSLGLIPVIAVNTPQVHQLIFSFGIYQGLLIKMGILIFAILVFSAVVYFYPGPNPERVWIQNKFRFKSDSV
jgi:O-antigen/teichoic acid export membrane protein